MNKPGAKHFARWLLAAFTLLPLAASAEDIDLYAGVGGGNANPNVLFFLDNTSNWSANSQKWSKATVTAKCDAQPTLALRTVCNSYVTQIFGTDLTLEQGRVELRALRLVLNELVCKTGAKLKVNAGIMMFSKEGTLDGSNVDTSYIRKAVANMDATRCAEVLADLDLIDAKINNPDYKAPSSSSYGTSLFEAFKYFGGWTNPAGAKTATAGSPTSGTHFGPTRYSTANSLEDPSAFTNAGKNVYKSPISGAATCGNNYIVLIGNTWPNQEFGANANASPPTLTQMTRLSHNPGAQIYPKPLTNSDKSDVRFADEWANFLYSTDVSDAPGIQNIRMFTVNVYNASADAKQTALLRSIANQSGPGGYFEVGGDLLALVNSFADILAQVASVNSVFSSASLPVSVNAQGTFLNQVFIGMFRPDADLQQRWYGNLKQYRFAMDSSQQLYLADSTIDSVTSKPRVAIDSQNTGFIQNCATSYWSTPNTYWSAVTGARQSICTTTTDVFSDAPDGPIVERGGAGQRLRDQLSRNIRTCRTLDCKVGPVNTLFDFSLANAPSLSQLQVDWIRGQVTATGDGTTSATGVTTYNTYGLGATAARPTIHGEIVHSRPLAINYGSGTTADVVVFYGAGDGMLRAVNGNQASTDGNELWAFVAPEHLSSLDRVRTNSPLISYPNAPTSITPTPTPKTYFFDGSIGGYQERATTASPSGKVWIYPTMRRGGRFVYGFDVTTKPGTLTSQPTLLWKFGCDSTNTCVSGATGEAQMGQSWSTPIVVRVKGNASPLVVFGAGYDTCEDSEDANTACSGVTRGRGMFVMSAQAGPGNAANYRYLDMGTAAGRFVADVVPVDVNFDGFADVLYAVDSRGNVWRVNMTDAAYSGLAVSAWTWQRVAVVAEWGTVSKLERRKFLSAPSIVMLGTQATVLVGSGDREKPLEASDGALVNNRFYGIRDEVFSTVSTPAVGFGSTNTVVADPSQRDLLDVTNLTPVSPTALANYKGWYRGLSQTTAPYEQVVTTPLTIGGVTYFSTFQAKSSNSTANQCTSLGTARAYQIDFQSGTAIEGAPLVTTFLAGGIPPSPVGGLVVVDGKTVPFLIGGPGPSPLSPTKVVPNVKATRKPIYRYNRIDG